MLRGDRRGRRCAVPGAPRGRRRPGRRPAGARAPDPSHGRRRARAVPRLAVRAHRLSAVLRAVPAPDREGHPSVHPRRPRRPGRARGDGGRSDHRGRAVRDRVARDRRARLHRARRPSGSRAGIGAAGAPGRDGARGRRLEVRRRRAAGQPTDALDVRRSGLPPHPARERRGRLSRVRRGADTRERRGAGTSRAPRRVAQHRAAADTAIGGGRRRGTGRGRHRAQGPASARRRWLYGPGRRGEPQCDRAARRGAGVRPAAGRAAPRRPGRRHGAGRRCRTGRRRCGAGGRRRPGRDLVRLRRERAGRPGTPARARDCRTRGRDARRRPERVGAAQHRPRGQAQRIPRPGPARARTGRLLLPDRRARRHHPGAGRRARAGREHVRVGRQPRRRLGQRPLAVLGG